MRGILEGILLCTVVLSCGKDERFSYKLSEQTTPVNTFTTTPVQKHRSVMLLYSAGYNSLYNFLKSDINELEEGYIPYITGADSDGSHAGSMAQGVLLVYSRIAPGKGAAPESALFRIGRKLDGTVVRDTLKVWDSSVAASSSETMAEVLNFAAEKFPTKSFGMVFSSHASGWLPPGYYSDPSKYESSSGFFAVQGSNRRGSMEFPPIEDFPAVKSIGQDEYPSRSVEMSLKDFADGIPFRLDYLLIDACLSGCVEFAAELRGKADVVGFSQAEVLAEGFNYKTIAGHLLDGKPDPVAVCSDYYDFYKDQEGVYRSATISVVDTRKMDALIAVCKTLFTKYAFQIKDLDGEKVQGFFRYNRHFFYDLEDILVKAGISYEEEAALRAALDECVIYKAATPYFMQNSSYGFRISSFSGLSMYLPSEGSALLDRYYKENCTWNRETELVK